MAKRASLIKRKPKTVRKTQSETYLVNVKYLGSEPSDVKTRMDVMNATNWYGIMCDKDDAREYLTTWLTSVNKLDLAKRVKSIPDTWLPLPAAWQCRIASRNKIEVDTARLLSDIEYAISKGVKESPDEKPKADKPSIQDRMRERADEILGDIEGLIDMNEKFSMYEWLKTQDIPASYAPIIVRHYAPWLDELLEALEGKDEQLKEAYSYMSKKELKERVEFFANLLSDVEKYAGVTKKTRAPRKPRAVSAEKKLKNFKFQKEDNGFKIASVNPEKIIGAQELWTFNTKYKTLSVFRALDRGGLDVKGTSIIKYDENTSVTKKTGRKPEVYVQKVMGGGKLILKKVMEELKSDAPLAYRINENTILLKVV